MARPTTITDEQILDAARAVFLEEGYGTQTAKIARRAGISEGSIFKRFRTKEDLFMAALNVEYPPAWWHLTEKQAGTGDLRGNLTTILVGMLDFVLEAMPRLFALMGHPSSGNGHNPLNEIHRRDIEILSSFFKREIEQGRIRSCDTELLIDVICGSLMGYAVRVMKETTETHSPKETMAFARGVVTLLWNGIAPDETA